MAKSKKNSNKLEIPKPKSRNHQMLFDQDLPFQPKVETGKHSVYKRKQKHKGKGFDND